LPENSLFWRKRMLRSQAAMKRLETGPVKLLTETSKTSKAVQLVNPAGETEREGERDGEREAGREPVKKLLERLKEVTCFMFVMTSG
jgi:predicted amidohydrolase YtcJ